MLWARPLSFIFVTSFLLLADLCYGIEIQPFYGSLRYDHLDGSYQSSEARSGTGVLVRLDTVDQRDWDFIGYADRKWSEFSVLRPYYIWGAAPALEPSPDPAITVRRFHDWDLVVSLGGGYFIHSTRTVLYDRPAIVSGFVGEAHTQLRYTFDDHWSALGAVHLGLSAAADDRGFLSGLFVGVNYRP